MPNARTFILVAHSWLVQSIPAPTVVGIVLQKFSGGLDLGRIFGNDGRVVTLQFVQANLAGQLCFEYLHPGCLAELQFRVGRFRCFHLDYNQVGLRHGYGKNRLGNEDGRRCRRWRRGKLYRSGGSGNPYTGARVDQSAGFCRIGPQPTIDNLGGLWAIIRQADAKMVTAAGRIIG